MYGYLSDFTCVIFVYSWEYMAMKMDMTSLPDNPEQLKQIIAELALEQSRYVKENDLLRERIRLLYAKLFGKRAKSMLPTATIRNCPCLICRNRCRSIPKRKRLRLRRIADKSAGENLCQRIWLNMPAGNAKAWKRKERR